MKVSVFLVYIVWARLWEQFWSCNGAVNFCFLNSHSVRLVKIKEGQQFNFFPLMLLMFMLTNFSPPIKLFLLVPNEDNPVFFSFVRGSNLFWFSKFNCSSKKKKKNQKSWKSHILGKSRYSLYFQKFHTEILRWKSILCEPTSHSCHTELPCDLLGQHHYIIHSQLCSLCNTKIRFLIPDAT